MDDVVAIDTPDAAFRRTGQLTAFEEAVRQLALTHPCVPRLRQAVRIVEFAAWRRSEYPAVEALETRLMAVMPKEPMEGGLAPSLEIIRHFCEEAP